MYINPVGKVPDKNICYIIDIKVLDKYSKCYTCDILVFYTTV